MERTDSWFGKNKGLNLRESIAISSIPGNSHSYNQSGDVSNRHSGKMNLIKKQNNRRGSINLTKNEQNKRGSLASLEWTPGEPEPGDSLQSPEPRSDPKFTRPRIQNPLIDQQDQRIQ